MPIYWLETQKVFGQVIDDLNEQQELKAKMATTSKKKDDPDNQDSSVLFVREGGSVKVPELRVLGDGTMNQIVRMIPDLHNNMNDKTPVFVHRFVTVPLEKAMEQ